MSSPTTILLSLSRNHIRTWKKSSKHLVYEGLGVIKAAKEKLYGYYCVQLKMSKTIMLKKKNQVILFYQPKN